MLGHRWEHAEATVVAKNPRPMTAGYAQTYDYVVDVQPATGTPIRATIHEGFRAPDGGFADPGIGATVGVLYDAKHEKVKFDNDDPRLSLGHGKADASAAFTAAAAAPPGTPPPRAAETGPIVRTIDVGGSSGDADDRLVKLEKLRQSGLLDEASYQSARRAVEDAR
jgi:hypothetical protein